MISSCLEQGSTSRSLSAQKKPCTCSPSHPDPTHKLTSRSPSAHLQTLSTSTPAPSSPTASSLSSFSLTSPPPDPAPGTGASTATATAQQILTAHMLLALLSSPPDLAMPLAKLKEVIGAKAAEFGSGSGALGGLGGIAGAGAGATKPVYACVAKRLLKIDRGRGEQVVRFDM